MLKKGKHVGCCLNVSGLLLLICLNVSPGACKELCNSFIICKKCSEYVIIFKIPQARTFNIINSFLDKTNASKQQFTIVCSLQLLTNLHNLYWNGETNITFFLQFRKRFFFCNFIFDRKCKFRRISVPSWLRSLKNLSLLAFITSQIWSVRAWCKHVDRFF